jgi:hypothetical protein
MITNSTSLNPMIKMKAIDFWKNFKLGEEISISVAFIYNGLRRYHEMRRLDFADEVFEFLYDVSIGLERLLKIAVILFEHTDNINQEKLEKSLITHSHLDLLERLRGHSTINLLGTFYKSLRYDRFTLASAYDSKKKTEAICTLLYKHLQVDFPNESTFLGIPNEDKYRRFIRWAILKISKTLYKIIESRASAINLYTYELRDGSKAESVFLRELDISDEDVLGKELLVFLMNTNSTSSYLEFLRNIPPLDFDPALIGDYLDCFQSDASKACVMDELEHHYAELGGAKGERLEIMGVIGSSNASFYSPDDDLTGDDAFDFNAQPQPSGSTSQ